MISSQTDICESLNLIELSNEFENVLYQISLVLSRSVIEINHLKTIGYMTLVGHIPTLTARSMNQSYGRGFDPLQLHNKC